jgi:hypothetical protein
MQILAEEYLLCPTLDAYGVKKKSLSLRAWLGRIPSLRSPPSSGEALPLSR